MKTAIRFLLPLLCLHAAHADDKLYATSFSSAPLGKVPPGWENVGVVRASPTWGVDANGFLKVLWKGDVAIIAYRGLLSDGRKGTEFSDGEIRAEISKTPDPEVFLGLVGRLQDGKNFYTTRFTGDGTLQLIKVADGASEILSAQPTRSRHGEGKVWTLSMTFSGQRLTGQLYDDKGIEQARVDALEEDGFKAGATGLQATNFAGARNFSIASGKDFKAVLTFAQINEKNAAESTVAVDDLILEPVELDEIEKLNTPFANVAKSYDVIVAGGGTGGWAAAIQASRMGAKVLLVEESDWIGGQMSAAAVTSMDEEGVFFKFPVRERGIYREFHQSMVNFYYSLNKDPYRAYYAWPVQLEGGYEPKWTRAMLYAFIKEARKKGTLDLVTGTDITKVLKDGDRVTGVELGKAGAKKNVAGKVLVEATEYGDILPLAGARYRAGTVTSENLVPDSPVQYDTYLGVIREYPEGLPDHLRIKEAPPGYEKNRYAKTQLYGKIVWGGEGKGYQGPRGYQVLLAWRGMADADSPATGKLSEGRHTQAGLNGGYQDYPMDVASLENMEARKAGQRDGIYRTMSVIYYLQNELGLNWGLAEDEGYNTEYNRKVKATLDLRPDIAEMAKFMPQMPYVRESRRGRGIYTLRTTDMGRFEDAKHWPTSVAIVDYFMDIDHGKTGHVVELDLDPGKPPRTGGPAQVPFEVFIPEKIDGLVFAEKNISQSRIVNGATRLQPSTMLTGQAAGAIAALAALENVQPRKVNPVQVQAALLDAGDNLIQRWYSDVPWGSPLWKATQLLSLHGVMDVAGPFKKGDGPMGDAAWNPSAPLDSGLLNAALKRMAELAGKPAPASTAVNWAAIGPVLGRLDPQWRDAVPKDALKDPVTREAFALAAAGVVKATARPKLLTDAEVPPPTPEQIAAAEKEAEAEQKARDEAKGKKPKPDKPAKDKKKKEKANP
ncbi:MAG: FAD-dependent oxidoreductase [Chthoniobacterales bacterium]|nr:FAD-dependent oxidoreductase [Chthoniobacterales bacterium]